MSFFPSPAFRSRAMALLVLLLLPAAGHAALRVSSPSPKDHPDDVHFPNGCYLSAITFLKRYAEENPKEETRVLSFAPRGWGSGHFVALLTWRGEWWIRDEYFGIIAVGLKVGAALHPARFDQRAANAFDHQVIVRRKAGELPILPWLPGQVTEVQRAESTAAAARFLPFPTEQFRVKCGDKEMTFLFFRPVPGRIAVYEPSHGTAVAVCAESDPAVIVAGVATRLGHMVDSVRPANPATATMAAAN